MTSMILQGVLDGQGMDRECSRIETAALRLADQWEMGGRVVHAPDMTG